MNEGESLIKQNPYEKVLENAVMTATKEELTLMLYEGGIRFCNVAITALEKKQIEKATKTIIRIQDIVREFQITLDYQYEISRQLNNMYEYMFRRLSEGNRAKDAEVIMEVRDLFREFRDMWKEAMKLARVS
jgi:flagellar protein FliS